jgi:hypothetical protein
MTWRIQISRSSGRLVRREAPSAPRQQPRATIRCCVGAVHKIYQGELAAPLTIRRMKRGHTARARSSLRMRVCECLCLDCQSRASAAASRALVLDLSAGESAAASRRIRSSSFIPPERNRSGAVPYRGRICTRLHRKRRARSCASPERIYRQSAHFYFTDF